MLRVSHPSAAASLHVNTALHRPAQYFEDLASPYSVSEVRSPVVGVHGGGKDSSESASPDHRHHSHRGSLHSGSASPHSPAALDAQSPASLSSGGGGRLRPLSGSPSGGLSRGGSVLHKRFDTVGDIARKYNIDASAMRPGSANVAAAGGDAVPRYAQSTIRSLIRGSNNNHNSVHVAANLPNTTHSPSFTTGGSLL